MNIDEYPECPINEPMKCRFSHQISMPNDPAFYDRQGTLTQGREISYSVYCKTCKESWQHSRDEKGVESWTPRRV